MERARLAMFTFDASHASPCRRLSTFSASTDDVSSKEICPRDCLFAIRLNPESISVEPLSISEVKSWIVRAQARWLLSVYVYRDLYFFFFFFSLVASGPLEDSMRCYDLYFVLFLVQIPNLFVFTI